MAGISEGRRSYRARRVQRRYLSMRDLHDGTPARRETLGLKRWSAFKGHIRRQTGVKFKRISGVIHRLFGRAKGRARPESVNNSG